jgi:hypothetical protein
MCGKTLWEFLSFPTGKGRWVLASGSEKATAYRIERDRERERERERALNDGSWVGGSVGRSVNEK